MNNIYIRYFTGLILYMICGYIGTTGLIPECKGWRYHLRALTFWIWALPMLLKITKKN